jgi:hypothetical protein
MFKFRKMAAAAAVLATMLCGCTQSNIVSPTQESVVQGDGQPDLDVDKEMEIDWVEVREDLREMFFEPYGEFGDYVLDLDARYDAETGELAVLLPVTGDPTGEIASRYAQAVLKTIGNSVATQNFYYTAPQTDEIDTDYGSFFEEHDVLVQVFPYDKEGEESEYIINDLIKAGDARAPEPQKQ